MMSTVAVLPPADPRAQLLPVVAGVAVAAALRQWLPAAALKWPNDIVVPARTPFKLGGLVAARQLAATDFVAVVGIGVNLRLAPADRPMAHARAVADFVEPPGRDELAVAVLQQWLQWLEAAPTEILGEYRRNCLTIGQPVRVLPVGGAPVVGTAVDVADTGALQVATAAGVLEFAAADVEHLRPT